MLHTYVLEIDPGEGKITFFWPKMKTRFCSPHMYKKLTHATEKKLRADLALTRERGYALDLAEGLEGIHCAGAVILDDFHYPVGAVTVIAPSFRLQDKQLDEAGRACIDAAREIRERLLK